MIRRYSELCQLTTFEERYDYLRLKGSVGEDTFGFDRIFNQRFYRSREWKSIRDFVIIRDSSCDLGIDGYEIREKVIIHHMNPISISDIETRSAFLLDPEFLISTIHDTHNAIHYGDKDLLIQPIVERRKNDTCPWRH
jgi:hypothetical protein